ncbi:hypothetical protein U9M48_025802 [Paspalum notatum var. saurae]|uniref:Uncharacterized protein n=1 Tax=Paspalum notatum var. saurae TaxID=547442 RepID=A0AAQ3TU02_PASNO
MRTKKTFIPLSPCPFSFPELLHPLRRRQATSSSSSVAASTSSSSYLAALLGQDSDALRIQAPALADGVNLLDPVAVVVLGAASALALSGAELEERRRQCVVMLRGGQRRGWPWRVGCGWGDERETADEGDGDGGRRRFPPRRRIPSADPRAERVEAAAALFQRVVEAAGMLLWRGVEAARLGWRRHASRKRGGGNPWGWGPLGERRGGKREPYTTFSSI